MLVEIWTKSLKTLYGKFFPNKATISRSANKNEFLQMNSSEIKSKLSYLTSYEEIILGMLCNCCAWTLSLGKVKATLNYPQWL